MIKIKHTFLVFSYLMLFGCGSDSDSDLLNTLKDVPEILYIDSDTLKLEANLYRDFMPTIIDPDNPSSIADHTALTCFVSLIETGHDDIETKYQLSQQYIIKRREFWEAEYTKTWSDQKYELKGVSGNGPKWDVGKKVDVVCSFKNTNTDASYYIMVKNQEIQRIE